MALVLAKKKEKSVSREDFPKLRMWETMPELSIVRVGLETEIASR